MYIHYILHTNPPNAARAVHVGLLYSTDTGCLPAAAALPDVFLPVAATRNPDLNLARVWWARPPPDQPSGTVPVASPYKYSVPRPDVSLAAGPSQKIMPPVPSCRRAAWDLRTQTGPSSLIVAANLSTPSMQSQCWGQSAIWHRSKGKP